MRTTRPRHERPSDRLTPMVAVALGASWLAACPGTPTPTPLPSPADSGPCGGVSEPCCTTMTCNPGLTCTNGTCTQTRVGDLGLPCSSNGNCSSGVCLPLSNGHDTCTLDCGGDAGTCLAGWTCGTFTGLPSEICQCTPSQQICNGKDDDCNGIVDDEPAVDAWCTQQFGAGYTCVNGSCVGQTCSSNADCLAGQICNPNTHGCELSDGDGGSGGNPDGGGEPASDAGPQNDGGATVSCTSKYDCNFGQACTNDRCVSPGGNSPCSDDVQCPRGQICISSECAPGCNTTEDCMPPDICSPTKLECEPCSSTNPCPSAQVCAPSGSGTQCQSASSCSSSVTCNDAAAGSVCVSGVCANCSTTSQCDANPYDSSYSCGANGLCVTGSSCDVSSCGLTCSAEGLTCDEATCTCTSTSACTDSDCGGVGCTVGTTCDTATCTCVSSSAPDAGTTCAGEVFVGTECTFICAFLYTGQCDSAGNCCPGSTTTTCANTGTDDATCTSTADCANAGCTSDVCVSGECNEEAIDSSGNACTRAVCLTGVCTGALTGTACTCASSASDPVTTSPVACQ